jgi:hypothetical protein
LNDNFCFWCYRALDKEKFRSDIKKKQIEVDELQTRLVVMERKARLREQLTRDNNMVRAADGGPDPDGMDIERLKEQLQEAQAELREKIAQLSALNKELAETKTYLHEAESKADVLTMRVEELVKSADSLHDHMEVREKEESALAKQQKSSLKEIEDLVKEVHREQAAVRELEKELASQKVDFEQQIAALGVATLQERIAQLEGELREQAGRAAEKERELKRQLDHARIEKEQIVRENKHLALAINKVAYMSKAITADFDAHKTVADSKLDSEMKKSQHMYAELKALSKSIDNVAGNALKRAKDTEARMDQLKRASDAAEVEFDRERQQLEQRMSDMQKELANKEKSLKLRITQATQAEISAKEAALKELGVANLVIDRLNGQLDSVRKTSTVSGGAAEPQPSSTAAAAKPASDSASAVEAKPGKQQEAELQQLSSKVSEREGTIAQLKEELARAAKQRKALEKDIEAERERYDDLRSDHNLAKDEIEQLEAQIASTSGAKNLSLPQSAESLHQREVTRLREELQAAKKDAAAKAKEIKTLQKEKDKAEKALEKKGAEPKTAKSPHVSKPKRVRTSTKVVATDSDSDEDDVGTGPPSAPTTAPESFREASEPMIITVTESRTEEDEAALYESFKQRYEGTKAPAHTVAAQTDVAVAAASVDKKRVEAILRQAIQTDNYYYSKQTGTFTNVYPVEEHLMEDLVDSFHAMGQDMLAVMRNVTGYGASLKEISQQGEATPQSVVDNIEAMILKGGKDLIINLEKSKERNFKKLVDEQRGKIENLTGALDSDIAYAKEEAMQEAAEKFQAQLQEIVAEKRRVEQELEETQDRLAVERAKVLEAAFALEQAQKERPRSARSRSGSQHSGGEGAEHSGSEDSQASGLSDGEEGFGADADGAEAGPAADSVRADNPVTAADGVSAEVAEESAGAEEQKVDVGLSSKSAGPSFKAIASAKMNLLALRKQKDSKKRSKQRAEAQEASVQDDATAGGEEAALGDTDKPRTPGTKKSRRKTPKPATFDDLDTGDTILKRLTPQQADDLKTMLLLDLKEEVKRGIVEKEQQRLEKEAAEEATNHHVSRDVQMLKDNLVAGKLQHIGEVRVSDFDRLRNKAFGPDDLISLTIVEHHVRYGGASDAYDNEEEEAAKTMSKEEAKRHALKRRQYRMLIRSMVLQRELLQKNVVTHTPLLELMRYKHATEGALAQLSALSAWRALNYYSHGGVFRDVLLVHLEVIDKCIAAAGGWQAALAVIESSPDPQLHMETSQWPEFFRVRVLEVLRTRYAEELEREKARALAAGSLYQGPPVEYVQSNSVLPFGQIMSTEANKRRVDQLTKDASSRAVEILGHHEFGALNRSVKKLKVVAAASFLAYQSSRALADSAEDNDGSETPTGFDGDEPVTERSQLSRDTSSRQDDTIGFSVKMGASSKLGGVTFAADARPDGENDSSGLADQEAGDAAVGKPMGTTGKHAGAGELRGIPEGEVQDGSQSQVPRPASKELAAASQDVDSTASITPLATPASNVPPKHIASTTKTTTAATAEKSGADPVAAAKAEKTSDSAWLCEEDDDYNDSAVSSVAQPSATAPSTGKPTAAASASVAASKAPAKGRGKGPAPAVVVKDSAVDVDAASAVDRPASPDDSVVSNLTTATPAPAPHAGKLPPPATTKSQKVRENAKKASNMLKFNKYDAIKHEEKKRKAAKAAETAAANQKAAGENMAKLAGSLGDMFGSSDDEGGQSGSDTELRQGSAKPTDKLHTLSDTESSLAASVSSKPGTAASAKQEAAESLQWMHALADKLVVGALYGDPQAVSLMHCYLDGVGHWAGGQVTTAAVVFKSALHLNLVPEIITELVQRTERRAVKIPPEVLEVRDKFQNIMGVLTKLAMDSEHMEQRVYEAQQLATQSHRATPHVLHQPLMAPGSQLPDFMPLVTGQHAPVHAHSHAAGFHGHAAAHHAQHTQPGVHVTHPGALPAHTHVHHHHHHAHPPAGHNAHHEPHNRPSMPMELTAHSVEGAHHAAPHAPGGHHQPHTAQHAHPTAAPHHPQAHHHASHAPHQQHSHLSPAAAPHLVTPQGLAYNPVLMPEHATGSVQYAPPPSAPTDSAPSAQPQRVAIERAYEQPQRVAIERAYEQPQQAAHIGLVHSSTMPSMVVGDLAAAAASISSQPAQTSAVAAHSMSVGPHAPPPAAVGSVPAQAHYQNSGTEHHSVAAAAEPVIANRRTSVAAIHYAQAHSTQSLAAAAQPFASTNVPGAMHTQHQRAAGYGMHGGAMHHGVKRKVAMFDNSTQTAHGSIQLHELVGEVEETENLSSLVRSLMLDGWEEKIKTKAKRKKESHTIITSAMAVPNTFVQAAVDPFLKHEDTTTVFKGFEHAYFDEAEFEVLPGVRLASAHRVAAAIRAHIRAEKERAARKSTKTGSVKTGAQSETTSASLSHEDDMHIGCWTMQTNIRYCIRSDGAEYGKRLKRVPYYMKVPQIPGCEAVVFPNVFPVQQGVNLITGEKSSMGTNLALPEDVLLLQVAEDTVLPPGLTQVELSPQLKLSASLQHFMQRTHPLPPGHHLVQLTEHSAVSLPEGVEVRSGVTIAQTPANLDLPSNVIVVKNPLNDELPEYMHRLTAVTNEEDDLIAEMKLNEFCCVLKRPAGIDFGLGVEILQRPPGHTLPPGMTLLSKDAYPDGLVLPEELELVQLMPRYDFPLGCRLNAEWKVWPRPDGLRLPPGVQLVYPDSTVAVPKLPPGVCFTSMPDIPYGVTLPPNTQAVEVFGSAAGKYPLPEGAILAPGITVLACEGLIPQPSSNAKLGVTTVRALNVLLVHRMPGAQLPPLVERGSKADLPVGTLLAENMDIVRVSVRFELPPGVRIQAGAKLGPFTQIAPGTDLVTLSGGKPDDDYSCTIRVLEWPHGVYLTPGTEFVRRPPAGYYLPVGYKEVVQPRVDPASLHGTWAAPPLPDYGMLVELPRAIHYATAQNLAEHITVGLEGILDGKIVTMPLGMVLASRKNRQCQWPAEMTPAPKSALNVSLVKVINRLNSENNQVVAEGGSTVQTFADRAQPGNKKSSKEPAQTKPAVHIEVVKLRPHFSLPPGCEIVPGLVVQRKPFWLHVPSGVELVTKYADSSGRLLPFPCVGVTRVQLRPDYILTGAEVDLVAADPTQSHVHAGSPTSADGRSSRSAFHEEPTRDWEMVDLEHTVKLSPTSLPGRYELVHVSELLESVHSWGPYLKGIEAVNRTVSEDGHPTVLPPLHFLIQRPLINNSTPLPRGFQLSVSHEYASWELPSLPPNIELMHLVPTYQLPMGINIMNTSVLNKNQFNTVRGKAGQPAECNVPQLQSGERISAGFSVIAKPFGSIAMAEILKLDGFYEDEAHAFVRVHDPRHFKLPKMMTLDRHSDKVVESVFGAELPPAWRKGYLSKHDQLGGHVTVLAESERKPSPGAALQGELMITDIIKFVRLPHGFPAPRERQKRAQARFALLKPAAQKIQTIVRMRGATSRASTSSADGGGGPEGHQTTAAGATTAPPQHTHTHHRKQHNHTGLVVYPRLLCIHKRDDISMEDAKEKFLTNVMLNRLTVIQQAEAKKAYAEQHRRAGERRPSLTDKGEQKETEAQMREDAIHRLQELLEAEHEQCVTSVAAVAKLEEEKAVVAQELAVATEKNADYEKQLSYDEDLKVLIQRLNLKLQSRAREIDEINEKNEGNTSRLEAQVDLLNTQVAYYQDLADSLNASNSATAEGSTVADAGSPPGKKSPVKGSTTDGGSAALTVEHFERFSNTLHQRYRDEVLSGLERMSELYAVSINSIVAEFESVLMNWPHWSPKDIMTAAIAWSRGHPAPPVLPTSNETVASQGARTIELRIPSTDDSDMPKVFLSPVKGIAPSAGASVGSTVQAASKGGRRSPSVLAFEDDTEDMSVLSDTESQILLGEAAGASSSVTAAADVSLSGYLPRDLTKDEHGKPVPLTPGFALNVKGLYKQPDHSSEVDLVPFTSSIHDNCSVAMKRARRMSKIPTTNEISSVYKAMSASLTTAPAPEVGAIQLSHSLNDLFAKQRRVSPRKGQQPTGRLPKLAHSGAGSVASSRQAENDEPRNIRYFDPAVLGAGAALLHLGSGGGSLGGSTANSVVGGASLAVGGAEEGMTVSADITAREAQEFLKGDEHRQEIRQKLQRSTQEVARSVRKDFSALLSAVHSGVLASLPKVLEQYQAAGNDTHRGAGLAGVAVEDYGKFSDAALIALQESLNTTTADASHLMKYGLGAVLLHSNLSMQQLDIEGDALRHQLAISVKRLELLEYLLQDARRKGTGDNEHSANDALAERVLALESRIERLLGLQVDPALSVLATMVKGVEDLREMEKRLKFTALIFKQKSAQVEAKLQANRDFEFNHSHKHVMYHEHSESEEEVDTFGVDAHLEGTAPISKSVKKKRIPVVHMLSKKDIKAMKHYAHNARMKARHCHARANYLKGECDEVMACIMDHMEAYQRAAQKLLPAHMLEQVLRASVHSYQNISAGARLDRAKAARAHDPPHSPGTGSLVLGEVRHPKPRRGSHDTVSLSGESVTSLTSAAGSLAVSQITGLSASYAGSSNTSVASGSGTVRTLKPIRGTEVTLQRSMVDASRNLSLPGAKFGAAGSMPLAPAQSHLLLRGHGSQKHTGTARK